MGAKMPVLPYSRGVTLRSSKQHSTPVGCFSVCRRLNHDYIGCSERALVACVA